MSSENGSRPEKREADDAANAANAANSAYPETSNQASTSQHSTPPFPSLRIIPVNQLHQESPPSLPSSEGQGIANTRGKGKGKGKGRKTAAPTNTDAPASKKKKDNPKVFQSCVSAPHILGNQLNPNSSMAHQEMSDNRSSELQARSFYNSSVQSHLVGSQLPHQVLAQARSSGISGSSVASGASGFSMLGGNGGSMPERMDQLLEQQRGQRTQYMRQQATQYDMASMLTILQQLRAENLALEERVRFLTSRRDHMLSVSIPIAGIPLHYRPRNNNIHPLINNNMPPQRARDRSSGGYLLHPQVPAPRTPSVPMETGSPPDQSPVYPDQHRRSPEDDQPPSGSR